MVKQNVFISLFLLVSEIVFRQSHFKTPTGNVVGVTVKLLNLLTFDQNFECLYRYLLVNHLNI